MRLGDFTAKSTEVRITSYNVCYTKLLRAFKEADAAAMEAETAVSLTRVGVVSSGEGVALMLEGRRRTFKGFRITSYNVCYTKLLRPDW